MPDNEFTTVQIDIDTREKLRSLAEANQRSMAAQLRWMINKDYLRLSKTVQVPTPPTTAQ